MTIYLRCHVSQDTKGSSTTSALLQQHSQVDSELAQRAWHHITRSADKSHTSGTYMRIYAAYILFLMTIDDVDHKRDERWAFSRPRICETQGDEVRTPQYVQQSWRAGPTYSWGWRQVHARDFPPRISTVFVSSTWSRGVWWGLGCVS